MSLWYKLQLGFLGKSPRFVESSVKELKFRKCHSIQSIFFRNHAGYGQLNMKLNTAADPLHKLVCLYCPTFIATKNVFARYRNGSQNRSKNVNIVLCGLGLVVALCEAKNYTKREKQFFRAAQNGDISELKEALQSGVDVNTRHILGWTALHTAAINGRAEAVIFLIEHGADVNAGDEFTHIYRTAREKGMFSMEVLMKREEEFSDRLNNTVPFKGFTALHYAVLADSEACVRALLDAGANPTTENDAGYRPIKYAAEGEIKDMLVQYTIKFDEKLEREEAEERRRFPLEQRLKQHIVGQEGAISIVASKRENA